MIKVGDFFKDLFRGESQWKAVILLGDDAYLWREFKTGIRKMGWSQQEFIVKSEKDWTADIFDATKSLSLFADQNAVLVDALEAKEKTFEPLWESGEDCERLFVRTSSLKKIPKGFTVVDFQIATSERRQWMQRMAKLTSFELTPQRLAALEELDVSALELDQIIQLWSLGGDVWWHAMSSQYPKKMDSSSQGKEAFEWVDAILNGQRGLALRKLRAATSQGQDPFMLLGLLAKSLKVGSQLLHQQKADAHEFVIKKIQNLLRDGNKKSRLLNSLEQAAFVDLAIKSSGLKPESALEKLSS